MAKETVEEYILDVRVPKKDPRRITIKNEMSLGSDSSCDIRIQDFGLSPLQARFRLQNQVLTLTNLGPENSLKVGSQKCGHGRMYILDKGDKCIIDKVKIIIRKDKVEVSKEEEKSGMEEETHVSSISEDDTQENLSPKKGIEKLEDEYEIVEEVVYVDEEGNEVNEPKEPTFVSKFRDMIKRKEKAKPIKKTGLKLGAPPILSKGKKIISPVAGMLPRFIGFLYNMALFIGIYKLVLPLVEEKTGVEIFKYSDIVFNLINPYLLKIPEQLPKNLEFVPEVKTYFTMIREVVLSPENFKIVFFFLAYELIFQLLFGIGLGQFLIGLKNGGQFILVRLLAPVRVLFSILLTPFLIFDFPIIFKKRSFKEITTFTKYQLRSSGLTAFLSLIVLPLAALLAANYKIYPAFFKEKMSMTLAIEKFPKNKGNKLLKEVLLQSTALNIKVKALLPLKAQLIPSISVENKPKLIVADLYKGTNTEIIRFEKVLPISKITDLLKRDPLLTFTFPDLRTAINDETGKEPIDNRQLVEILYHALSFNILDPIKTIQALGVILSPYYEIHELLFNKLSTKRITMISLIEGSKESMVILGNPDANASRFILRATQEELEIIEFKFDKKDSSYNNKIMSKTFYHTTPFNGKYENAIKTALKSNEPHVLSMAVLDIFNNVINGNKITNAEAKLVSDQFIFLSAQGLKTESNEFQQILLDNFESMDKILLSLKTKNKDESLANLRLSLNRIQQALYKRDQKFFKLNK